MSYRFELVQLFEVAYELRPVRVHFYAMKPLHNGKHSDNVHFELIGCHHSNHATPRAVENCGTRQGGKHANFAF